VLLQVTLIDQSERFVFKPLLYDFVAGTAKAWEVAPYFQQLLAPYNINFLQARLHQDLLHARSHRPGLFRVVWKVVTPWQLTTSSVCKAYN
jgi:hypothetical protein